MALIRGRLFQICQPEGGCFPEEKQPVKGWQI